MQSVMLKHEATREDTGPMKHQILKKRAKCRVPGYKGLKIELVELREPMKP